jgi:hypothetical protein
MEIIAVHIEGLHRRLIEIARQRVRSGQITESGLARLCGLSQPHMGKNYLDSPYSGRILLA